MYSELLICVQLLALHLRLHADSCEVSSLEIEAVSSITSCLRPTLRRRDHNQQHSPGKEIHLGIDIREKRTPATVMAGLLSKKQCNSRYDSDILDFLFTVLCIWYLLSLTQEFYHY